jgi:NADPH2:quinone reductase
MPFEHAAAFLFTYATSYYALKSRGRLAAGETVLVLGAAGGVGIAAIQIAKAMGARVIAAVSSESKLKFVRKHGADDGLVYPAAVTSDGEKRELSRSMKSLLSPSGADVVLDPVGGALSEVALRCTAERGRFLILGFTAGIPLIPLNLPLLKSCDILGVNWRTLVLSQPEENEANQKALFEMYDRRLIAPVITETFPLDLGGEAIRRFQDRTVMGKMVVTI